MLNCRASAVALGVLSLTLYASLIGGSPANATPVIVGFSGVIDSVTDPSGFLDPSTQVGSAFTGTYTIDLAAGTTASAHPIGTAYFLTSPGSRTVTVEGDVITEAVPAIIVSDDRAIRSAQPEDAWILARSVVFNTLLFNVTMFDVAATRLNSEALFLNTSFAGWDDPSF